MLHLEFTTVRDYLFMLKEITLELNQKKTKFLVYLAAAVSDFFVPHDKMVGLMLDLTGST